MTFKLILLTPNGVIFDGEANYCYVPAANGPIGILPLHAPLVARIPPKGGILHFQEPNGRIHYYAVKNGAVEVKKEKTLVLLENFKACSTPNEAKSLLETLHTIHKKAPSSEKDVKLGEAFSQKGFENR